MKSIVETKDKPGATGIQAQSLRDEVRHLWARMQLQLPKFENSQLRIAFCSTHPGEGTTTVAANFAIFLGAHGHKTTLAECNLRNPSLGDHFGVPRSPGICEFLDESSSLEESMRRTVAPGLDLVTAGSPPVDVYGTLSNKDRLERLLEGIREQTEFCVVDAPPISVAPEAAPILRAVDAAVLVVQADRTRKKSVEKSLQTFEELGIHCCGIVLNRIHYEVPPFIDQVL